MKKSLAVILLVIGGLIYNLMVSALSVWIFMLGLAMLGLLTFLAIPAVWVPLGIPIKNLCRKYEQKYDIKAPVFFLAAHAPSLFLSYAVLCIHDLSVFVPRNIKPFWRQSIELSVGSLFITAPGLLLSVLLWYFVFDKRRPKGGAL